MNSEFIVKARKLSRSLSNIKDGDIEELYQLRCNLHNQIKDTISRNRQTGFGQLTMNCNEVILELGYIEPKIKAKLKTLSNKGLDEYDPEYWNVKELAHEVEGCLTGLFDLMVYYFPDTAIKNESKIKEFASIPAKKQFKQQKHTELASADQSSATGKERNEDNLNAGQIALIIYYLEQSDYEARVREPEAINEIMGRHGINFRSSKNVRTKLYAIEGSNNETSPMNKENLKVVTDWFKTNKLTIPQKLTTDLESFYTC